MFGEQDWYQQMNVLLVQIDKTLGTE